ncbi:TonB-dependent receptor [Marinilabiliaceae bacterium ANBcel2]|nr:TonB-dependent receptor [Marinilabiliaceae bacterium ANBcel2]
MIFLVGHQLAGQTVSGTVMEFGTQEPLPGVTITIEETSQGTVTDMDGNFEISLPSDNEILRFTYIGFQTKYIEVEDGEFYTIYLEPDDITLDDVIVVGYGTQRRENLTGAVSTVNVERDLETRPITDVAKGLQGLAPGLTITSNTGDLGETPNIRLRGNSGSLNTAAQPLILVDNVEIPDLSMVNPSDIESISVLKDAAASSIYGSRAAFGVILITTKSGSDDGTVSVNYNSNFSWNKPTSTPEIADAAEGAEMAFAALQRANPSVTQFTTLGMSVDELAIEKMRDWKEQYGDQDLSDEMVMGRDFEYRDGRWYFYRPWDVTDLYIRDWAPQQNHNLNVSGGNEITQYTLGFGLLEREGILKAQTDSYDRYNVTLNIASQVHDRIKLRSRSMLSKSNFQTPYSYSGTLADPWYYLLRWPEFYPYGTYEGLPFRNAITEIEQANMIENKTTLARINLGATVDLADGLTWDTDYTYTENNNHVHEPGGYAESYDFWGGEGIDNFRRHTSDTHNRVTYRSSWHERNTFKSFITYDQRYDEHEIKAMGGTDVEKLEYWMHSSERRSLIDKDKPELSLATGDQYVSGARNHWSTLGFFGRINYSYRDRYLFELNGRYDGSSRFPADDQWAFFPSFSVGYRITEEDFMDFSRSFLYDLKLRGSWGSIGNHDVGTNTFLRTMGNRNSNWIINGQNQLTMGSPRVVASSLTWETVTTLNFGVDARLLNNHIGFMFDWYERTTSDMITSGETLPNSFGASAPQQNYGELQTRGWEFALDWNYQFVNGLSLTGAASIADFKEEIVKFPGDDRNIYGYYEGKQLGEIWGYETDRFFTHDDFVADDNGELIMEDGRYILKDGIPSQEVFESGWFSYGPGDVKYKDLNGDGEINYGSNTIDDHGDLRRIGNSTPRYQYSFQVGGDYRGVDFSIFFQGVGKRDMWASGPVFIPGYRPTEAWYDHQLDYWTPDNPDAFYPRPTDHDWINNGRNFLRQTKYMLDMSYLRCKNVTVGYTIPDHIINRTGLANLRLYFSGENLFEFDNMDIPMDPETGDREGAYGFSFGRSYPYSRTISFGLQIAL